jgi:hypothetical protein
MLNTKKASQEAIIKEDNLKRQTEYGKSLPSE